MGLHLIGIVGYSLLLRRALVAKADKWTQATIMQTAIALPMVIASFFLRPDLSTYTASTAVLLGLIIVLVIALHAANVLAVQHLEASTYSILYNLRLVFVTILGILFLGEKVVFLQLLGGLLIFIAAVTVRKKAQHHTQAAGVWWGVAAAALLSVLSLCEKRLMGQVGFYAYIVMNAYIATPIMWAILLARGTRVKLAYITQKETIIFMAFRAISAYGFVLAISTGLLSVTSYISGMSVVLIVLFGALLLGEKDHMRSKLIATALVVAGLTAILLANL